MTKYSEGRHRAGLAYQACWPAEFDVLNSWEASAGELEPGQVDMGRMSLHTVSWTVPSALRKISTTLLWLSPDTMIPFTYKTNTDVVNLLHGLSMKKKSKSEWFSHTSKRMSPTLRRPSCSATPPQQISFTLSVLPLTPPTRAKPSPPLSGLVNSTWRIQLYRKGGTGTFRLNTAALLTWHTNPIWLFKSNH